MLRPQADAERSAGTILARGHEPVIAPLFEIVRVPETSPDGPFAALVLTSGNAVAALAEAPASWRELPVFTVGARTAAKVRETGFGDARSADGDRHALVDLIGGNMPTPARLLLIAGRDSHDDVRHHLAEAGYDVALWTSYAAEAVSILPKAAAVAMVEGEVDAVLHYSTRGAETFLSLTQAVHLADEALELTHVAISAEAAAPLIRAGAKTVLVAEHPEEAAMFAALDQVSARNRSSGDGREKAIAPANRDMDKDLMSEPDDKPIPRTRSRRTPPTIEAVAQDTTAQEPAATEPAPSEPIERPDPATGATPESVLPTEALPREYPSGDSMTPEAASHGDRDDDVATPPPPEERRPLPLTALALSGLGGGIIGAGLMMLSMSGTPGVSPAQIADLRSRIDSLQSTAATLDRKAGAASDAATKAAADAQAATGRINQIAATRQAQTPDAGAITGLSEQASRTEAAATALGERLDQTTARIGSIETLARTAAAPSPQALAAARIVLAERVQTAIASGQPFAADVAALAKGGGAAEQIAALNAVAGSGAATRDALLAQFRGHRPMFAREMTPVASSWQDRVLGLASRIVTIRPVGESADNDPGTLLIRLENAVANGNIVAAAGLWGQLPEPARRNSADFGTALQKRAAAEAAIAKIAQDAVAALGAAG
ncbi:uroporphyrinogen-III synthase [Bosea sp. PAMC 26642]|uniref:uroporphyrinogen-III synthase n=1 Tax=Bosea sp. (strain PAMC 26642) TaxID=1792307 RepID=UPI001439F29C|nr:uroporphyrinogen-III synthase [Bosea sp. PAMC 26642]